MVKRIQVREPRSALWPWVMCSILEAKDCGTECKKKTEEDWDWNLEHTYWYRSVTGIFKEVKQFIICETNRTACLSVYIWLHKTCVGGYVIICVCLLVGLIFSRITHKLLSWFPLNLNRGWISTQNRPSFLLVWIQVNGQIWVLFPTVFYIVR